MQKQGISEVQKTIMVQIGARELNFARFNVMWDSSNLNRIIVQKGQKSLTIEYKRGSDLYDVKTFSMRGFKISEDEQTGVYAEMLRPMIVDFFPNFEYVMDSIRIVGWNA